MKRIKELLFGLCTEWDMGLIGRKTGICLVIEYLSQFLNTREKDKGYAGKLNSVISVFGCLI